MPQLLVVRLHVHIHQRLGDNMVCTQVIHKIKHHVRVVHLHIRAVLRETIIVIPFPHHAQHGIRIPLPTAFRLVILQHLPHLTLRKAQYLIETRVQRYHRGNVKATGHVVQRHRRYPRDEHPLHRCSSPRRHPLDFVEKETEKACPVRQRMVTVMTVTGQHHIREIVILVNYQVNRQTRLLATQGYVFQTALRIRLLGITFQVTFPKQMPVFRIETLETN